MSKLSKFRENLRRQIINLKQTGLSDKKIAAQLSVSRKMVAKWKFCTGSVKAASRPGRPSKIDPATILKINEIMKDKWGISTKKTAMMLNNSDEFKNLNKSVHRTTILRHIQQTDWGRRAYSSNYVYYLMSDKTKYTRLTFCKTIKEMGFCDDTDEGRWLRSHIMFTDETMILYRFIPTKNVRIRTANIKDMQKTFQIGGRPLKVMIAGGLCRNGLTDVIVLPHTYEETGKKFTVTSETYLSHIVSVYEKNMVDNKSASGRKLFDDNEHVFFMQDGAKPHTATKTIVELRKKFHKLFSMKSGEILWPPYSPDLNPIENLWSYFKTKLYESDRQFIGASQETKSDMKQFIEEQWLEFDRHKAEVFEHLVDSFGARVLKCIENLAIINARICVD